LILVKLFFTGTNISEFFNFNRNNYIPIDKNNDICPSALLFSFFNKFVVSFIVGSI